MERLTLAQRWHWSGRWLPLASHPSEPRAVLFASHFIKPYLRLSRKQNPTMNPDRIELTVIVLSWCIYSWQFALQPNCLC